MLMNERASSAAQIHRVHSTERILRMEWNTIRCIAVQPAFRHVEIVAPASVNMSAFLRFWTRSILAASHWVARIADRASPGPSPWIRGSLHPWRAATSCMGNLEFTSKSKYHNKVQNMILTCPQTESVVAGVGRSLPLRTEV